MKAVRALLDKGALRDLSQRLLQLGFWFFLIKGLLWLLVPLTAVWFGFAGDA